MNTLTVAEILKLDIFKRVSVRAGTIGLSRAVTGITTAEDPDLIQWLNGGEILLTSLYDASIEPFSYKQYMGILAKKNISALIVKISTRVPEIPEDIIEMGNLYDLPIIEFPPDIRFFDIISSVMKLILQNKAQYYNELKNNMSQVLASGGQEQDILNYLVQYIPAKIYITDSEKIISHEACSREFQTDKAIADRITLPIMCMGEVEGYLEAIANQYLKENLEGLLKSASNLLSVFFLKKYYAAEIEKKYISSFLNDLFHGNIDEKELEKKVEGYGWEKTDSFLIATIQLESSRSSDNLGGALVEMAHLVPKNNHYCCIQDDFLHILYHSTSRAPDQELYESMIGLTNRLRQYITKIHHSFSFFAGISSLASDINQLTKTVPEASDALQFSRVFHNEITKYEDLGMLRMLASYSHNENLEQIIPPAIKKLAAYDTANNTQYLETLDSLLGNNMNLSKTAKELFIHYKTMLHRMNRICEIAEISLDDRQTRLDVELGIKLYMLIPK